MLGSDLSHSGAPPAPYLATTHAVSDLPTMATLPSEPSAIAPPSPVAVVVAVHAATPVARSKRDVRTPPPKSGPAPVT